MEKSCDDVEKPKLCHSEMSVVEDELKSELDALNALVKAVTAGKENLKKSQEQSGKLKENINQLEVNLSGELDLSKNFK